jgi:hypothetical protein
MSKREIDIYLRHIEEQADPLVMAHIAISGKNSYVRKYLEKLKNTKNFSSVRDNKDNLPMIEIRYHEPDEE